MIDHDSQMIVRLTHPRYSTSIRTPNWPLESANNQGHLFVGRSPFRRLIAMVDADLLDTLIPPSPPTPRQILTDLLDLDLVELHRYADDGPPKHEAPRPRSGDEFFLHDVHDGWAVVIGSNEQTRSWSVSFSSDPNSRLIGGVMGNAPEMAAADTESGVDEHMSSAEAARSRYSDELAAQVASQALNADLFITKRPYLHTARSRRNPLSKGLVGWALRGSNQ